MSDYPIRLGGVDEFRAVRECFTAAGFTEQAACERLGLRAMRDLTNFLAQNREVRAANMRRADELSRLVQLFIAGSYVPAADLASMPCLDALESLGLVRYASPGGTRMAYSPVFLFPCCGLYLVSDRYLTPEGGDVPEALDFVFLPLQANAQNMMEGLPATPCRAALDIGTGCGIMGLWTAANGAAHVTLTDIAPRSTHFAEFGRRLNGIENVETLTGDLYAPVAGRRFDRIITHPPYDIAAATKFVFADGGDDGERITRRVVEGLADHLEPGGRLYCVAMGSHREGALFEQRIREWLGESSPEFDLALLVRDYMSTDAYAIESVTSHGGKAKDLLVWKKRFETLQVKELVYGFIILQRRATERPVFTIRRQLGPRTRSPEMEWLLGWETAATEPGMAAQIRAERPRATERFRLVVEHRIEDADLRPFRYTFRAEHPFMAELEAPPWMAYAASLANGSRTGAEIETALYERGALPRDARGADQFTGAMCALISAAAIELAGHESPADPETRARQAAQ